MAIRDTYKNDYVFVLIFDYLKKLNKNIPIVPVSIKHFELRDELLYFGLYGQDKRDHLYIPINTRLPDDSMTLRQALVYDLHDPSTTGGHLGVEKMLEKLIMTYYWLNMSRYVKRYIASCDICQCIKPLQVTQGLLQPLLIPEKKWQAISM